MRNFKTLGLVVLSALVGVSVASAADLPSRKAPPPAPEPYVAPYVEPTGAFYVLGAAGCGLNGSLKIEDTNFGGSTSCGGQLGVGYQTPWGFSLELRGGYHGSFGGDTTKVVGTTDIVTCGNCLGGARVLGKVEDKATLGGPKGWDFMVVALSPRLLKGDDWGARIGAAIGYGSEKWDGTYASFYTVDGPPAVSGEFGREKFGVTCQGAKGEVFVRFEKDFTSQVTFFLEAGGEIDGGKCKISTNFQGAKIDKGAISPLARAGLMYQFLFLSHPIDRDCGAPDGAPLFLVW